MESIERQSSADNLDVGVIDVTLEEGKKVLDDQARKYLGMSGEEFLERYEAGTIEDPDRSEVVRVSMLIPFAKPK